MDFTIIIALVIAVTIHEFSHAWVANKLGDPTARLAGRLTLNPFAHLDILGTLMLFLIHIGWGKPVPVNPEYFSRPKRDSATTALAGPFSNLLTAIVLAVFLKYFSRFFSPNLDNFVNTVFDISILLFVFNMLPFPPLDGSKIVGIFVPNRFYHFYQRYLEYGMRYFIFSLLFDQFILIRILGFSLLQIFMGTIFVFLKTILLLGT